MTEQQEGRLRALCFSYRAVEQRNRPLTWGSIELRLPQWPT